MQTLFYVFFGVGVGYTLLSFIFGHFLHFGDASADADASFDTSADASFDASADGGAFDSADASVGDACGPDGHANISPLKPIVIAAFCTVFGGTGIIFYDNFSLYLTLSAALVLGAAVAYCMYRFVVIPLYRAQNTSTVEKQSLVGHTAKVTEFIPQGKYGKITYVINGSTFTAPAKSENGEEITRNTKVEIIHIDKNTYYVAKAD